MASKNIYPIGTLPPLGVVPEYMYAQVIRQDRLGVRMSVCSMRAPGILFGTGRAFRAGRARVPARRPAPG